MVRTERWVVVGGGMLGLVAAESGARAGHSVTLVEGAPALGGLTSSVDLALPGGGVVTADAFYHVVLESDARVRALLRGLGLEDSIRWTAAPAVVAQGGAQHPASSLGELAGLPVLSTLDRARTAASIAASLALPLPLARRITAERWLTAIAGRRATGAFWGPILRAKLGTAAPAVSADFLVATFRRLVQARLSGSGDRFGVVAGGYAPVFDALARQARAHGVRLRTGTAVRRITRSGGALRVEPTDGDVLTADRVVVTTPGPVTAGLLPDLTGAEVAALTAAPYLGVVCGVYLLEQAPNDAYITYLVDDVGITGVIGMHALVDPRTTGGRHLVYVPRYCTPDDPWFDEPDDVLDTRLRAAVERALPGAMGGVSAVAITRARHVTPLPTSGAPAPLPVDTSIPGVHVISGAQNTSGTANVEQTLALASGALDHILKRASKESR